MSEMPKPKYAVAFVLDQTIGYVKPDEKGCTTNPREAGLWDAAVAAAVAVELSVSQAVYLKNGGDPKYPNVWQDKSILRICHHWLEEVDDEVEFRGRDDEWDDILKFGRFDGLYIELEWLGPDSGLAADATRGRLSLFVAGSQLWGDGGGLEWTWVELLEFLSEEWSSLTNAGDGVDLSMALQGVSVEPVQCVRRGADMEISAGGHSIKLGCDSVLEVLRGVAEEISEKLAGSTDDRSMLAIHNWNGCRAPSNGVQP
jgi:hypothetical protein